MRLSRKEAIILRMLCEGLSLQEIAYRARVAETTLRWYLSVLRSGLGVSSRTELQHWALQHPRAFRGVWTEARIHPMGCMCGLPYCAAVRAAWTQILAVA